MSNISALKKATDSPSKGRWRLILLSVAVYLAYTIAHMAFNAHLSLHLGLALSLVTFSLILLVFESRWSDLSNLAMALNVFALTLIVVKLLH
ncbi:MAG: hypothetical protein K8F91_14485 [Candidatus Obscuribacterales bacterium]|nr:hypothetical protein [Candidatus Obscuribacterales bacterium]